MNKLLIAAAIFVVILLGVLIYYTRIDNKSGDVCSNGVLQKYVDGELITVKCKYPNRCNGNQCMEPEPGCTSDNRKRCIDGGVSTCMLGTWTDPIPCDDGCDADGVGCKPVDVKNLQKHIDHWKRYYTVCGENMDYMNAHLDLVNKECLDRENKYKQEIEDLRSRCPTA